MEQMIDDDRLFPADPGTRGIARALYDEISGLPLIQQFTEHFDAGANGF